LIDDAIAGGNVTYVDTTTAFNPPVTKKFGSNTLTLGKWAVAFVQLNPT